MAKWRYILATFSVCTHPSSRLIITLHLYIKNENCLKLIGTNIPEDETFYIICFREKTFCVSGKRNTNNVSTSGSENCHVIEEIRWGSSEKNVWCRKTCNGIARTFFSKRDRLLKISTFKFNWICGTTTGGLSTNCHFPTRSFSSVHTLSTEWLRILKSNISISQDWKYRPNCVYHLMNI